MGSLGPARGSRSRSCEAARPSPGTGPAAPRACARANPGGTAIAFRPGRQHDQPSDGGGDPAPVRARPDLDARVPRAARPHLLALPDAGVARAAAGPLYAGHARDRARFATARADAV